MSFVQRVKWLTTLWCQTAHAWLFMYAETCQRCAIAKRQRGPGQQPSSPAAWQAALALGWPLPPPGCPHSLTSLAWQQQPNKLRAPQSSHRSMGMFFTAPNPHPTLYGHYGLCAVHKHTHMSNEISLLSEGTYTSLHVLYINCVASLSLSVMNIVGADLLVGRVKNALKSWHCFVACVGARCMLQSQLQFSKKASKNLSKLLKPTLWTHVNVLQKPRTSTVFGWKKGPCARPWCSTG